MSRTKYDILKGYADAGEIGRIRDTWKNLGGSIITKDSKTFIKDMVYKVVLSSSIKFRKGPLDGAYVLCEVSSYGDKDIDFAVVEIQEESQGIFCFKNNVATPFFRVILMPSRADDIIEDTYDPGFIPYNETETALINITDLELQTIMVEAGIPFITWDELEYSRAQICNLMIKPALEEYFKYFPHIVPMLSGSYSTAGVEISVPFPEGAYGVCRAWVNNGYMGGGSPSNPLHYAMSELTQGGNPTGGGGGFRGGSSKKSSPGFANLQHFGVQSLDMAAKQGIANMNTRFHVRVEKHGDINMVKGYSNKTGPLEIHWAMMSNNWKHVEFNRLNEARGLATAKVLRAFGMLRMQAKSDTAGAIDYTGFLTRADALELKTLAFWEGIPRTPLIRGQM
jgi:hypothetical protein